MPGSVELFIWYLGTAFELAFVVCSIVRKSFFTYFFLNLYMLLDVLADDCALAGAGAVWPEI